MAVEIKKDMGWRTVLGYALFGICAVGAGLSKQGLDPIGLPLETWFAAAGAALAFAGIGQRYAQAKTTRTMRDFVQLVFDRSGGATPPQPRRKK